VTRCTDAMRQNLKIQVKNDLSEPFNILCISNYCRKSNIVFFEIFLLFFWVGRKLSLLDDPKSSNQTTFSWPKKIVKKFKKNIKFVFLQEFDMKSILDNSNRTFLI
jgi:hypothetical protein